MQIDPHSGWCDSARHSPSANFNQRPAGEISLLVIHNISLPPGQFGTGEAENLFLNRLDPAAHPFFAEIAGLRVSAHFLIERDGGLLQFVSCNDRAWHAGQSQWQQRSNCNDFSVGIELEGTDELPYTASQYQVLSRLTAALLEAYPQMSRERICGHSDIAPGRKTDPGPAFDWARYHQMLDQELS